MRQRRRAVSGVAERKSSVTSELDFKRKLKLVRTEGTGVFIEILQQNIGKNVQRRKMDIPAVLAALVSRIPALPSVIVIFTVKFLPIPFINEEDRFVVHPIAPQLGVFRVVLNQGYQEPVMEVVGILERARVFGLGDMDTSKCTFYIGKVNVQLKQDNQDSEDDDERKPILAKLQLLIKRLRVNCFELLNNNVHGHTGILHLPAESTIEVGSSIVL